MESNPPPESPILRVSETIDGTVSLESLQFHPNIVRELERWLDVTGERLLEIDAKDIAGVSAAQATILTVRDVLKLPQAIYDLQKTETKAAAAAQAAIPEEPGSAGWPLKR